MGKVTLQQLKEETTVLSNAEESYYSVLWSDWGLKI